MSFDPVADAASKNAKLREQLKTAKAEHGYLACYLGGAKIHAAVTSTRGHSGYEHPRALCQRATPRSYASAYDTHREVTCLRCIASLQDLKHAVGAR